GSVRGVHAAVRWQLQRGGASDGGTERDEGRNTMTMTASADTARTNRRRGSAPDGVTFWHTLYLGTTRYNMVPGTPDPDASALFPMAVLVEQDPGSTANSHY